VDRVTNNVCEPYAYLKNAIYEKRLILPRQGINLLTEELIGLKRNNTNGKIDHDPSGINSKDSADAICGSLYNASQHAEEFAYDFGEDAAVIFSASQHESTAYEQMTVDFEEELKKLSLGNTQYKDRMPEIDTS
jgi:hypothetical protein